MFSVPRKLFILSIQFELTFWGEKKGQWCKKTTLAFVVKVPAFFLRNIFKNSKIPHGCWMYNVQSIKNNRGKKMHNDWSTSQRNEMFWLEQSQSVWRKKIPFDNGMSSSSNESDRSCVKCATKNNNPNAKRSNAPKTRFLARNYMHVFTSSVFFGLMIASQRMKMFRAYRNALNDEKNIKHRKIL